MPRTRVSGALTAVSEQVLDNDEPTPSGRRIPAYSVADVKLAQSFSWGRLAVVLNKRLRPEVLHLRRGAASSLPTVTRSIRFPAAR